MGIEVLAVNGWEQWHPWHAKVLAPVVDWFADAVARPGAHVLDAACGTGLPSIALAQRGARVTATDVSDVMVASARRISEAAGAKGITHQVMDLASLDFPAGTFDAATCAFGIIYLPEPSKALTQLRRVVKPGGTLAVTAWDSLDQLAFFRTLFAPMKALGLPVPDATTPGPLRLSEPGALEAAFTAAGFDKVTLERRTTVYEMESIAQHWEIVSSLLGPLAAAVKTRPAAEIDRVKAAFADALAPFVSGGKVRLPNVALCATATA